MERSGDMTSRAEVADLLDSIFDKEIPYIFNDLWLTVKRETTSLRESGQKEYAHGEDNAFGNFERLASMLDINRESILWVYATKHLDGITSYLKGHKSQREDVRGRINDVIVYLILLRGMIDQKESN